MLTQLNSLDGPRLKAEGSIRQIRLSGSRRIRRTQLVSFLKGGQPTARGCPIGGATVLKGSLRGKQ